LACGSSVGTETELLSAGCGVRIVVDRRDCSLLPKRPQRLRGPATLLFNVYRVAFQEVKRPGLEAYKPQPPPPPPPPPPPSAELKNEWIQTSTPSICFHGVDKENLTLSANTKAMSADC
jgi:hypothetical protein